MARKDREPVFTSIEVIYELRHLGVVRVTAAGLESLGFAQVGSGELLIKSLLSDGFLRCLSAEETKMTWLKKPYDVVAKDGSVVSQANQLRKYQPTKKENKIDQETGDDAGKEQVVGKELSLAVRQRLPGLAQSLRREFGDGIYTGFPGIKLVGSDRCVTSEIASNTLCELLECGFVKSVNDTVICFTDKAKVVIENQTNDSATGHEAEQPTNGGLSKEVKQRYKHLRREIRKIVVELGQLNLVVDDKRLVEVITRLKLDHIKDVSTLFTVCAELSCALHPFVSRVGQKEEFYVEQDDELRLMLQQKKLASPAPEAEVVMKPKPQVAVNVPDKTQKKEMTMDKVGEKAGTTEKVQTLDPKWVDFLFAHKDAQNWLVRSLIRFISKGKPFWTIDMVEVLVGRKNPGTGNIISSSNASSNLYQIKVGGYLALKRRGDDKGAGSDAVWTSSYPGFDHDLAKLLEEYSKMSEVSAPTQSISGPEAVVEAEEVVVQDAQADDVAQEEAIRAAPVQAPAQEQTPVEVPTPPLPQVPSNTFEGGAQWLVENLFRQQQLAHEAQVRQLQEDLVAARTEAAVSKKEVQRLQAVLSQLASIIEAAKT